MTRYAFDASRHFILASWPTGRGDIATDVCQAPPDTDAQSWTDVVHLMTLLSERLWRSYAATSENTLAIGDYLNPLPLPTTPAEVVTAITDPPLLDKNGYYRASNDPTLATAEALGRTLHAIGDQTITQAVADEATRELNAVDAAERADLRGRAAQAALITRHGSSPVHVALAHDLLRRDPFDPRDLFTDLDPTSAALTAAHWLTEALHLTGETIGAKPTDVLSIADDYQAYPLMAVLMVTEIALDDDGDGLRYVVEQLIADALLVADGHPPTDEVLAGMTDQTWQRLTPLDPGRPALDLLEDLVTCLDAAFLVWRLEAGDDIDEAEEEDDDTSELERRREQWDQFSRDLQERAHANRWKIGLTEPPEGTRTDA